MATTTMTTTMPAAAATPDLSESEQVPAVTTTEEPTSEEVLGFHRGAIDQTTITTRPPSEVMKQVDAILYDMGVEIQKESTFKYRCVRPQKGADLLGTPKAPSEATYPIRMSSPDYIDSPTIESSHCDFRPKANVLYGSPSDDSMSEVRFSVEITKLSGLKGTYSLDIRRLKGNLKSYGFIYNTIRERAELNH